uniref:Uncharacterized protein n=1 Tax=Chromera velia CCMP2878 TaxID=1169474 RepID=A0A0G4GVB1_9ALVE|eukprot:Cvel_23537.t1-p1 / transcript=Cvel_23537.t1 / gene=Cvel_23537 / organism=Chromera_velia_CCMP2878 / gene_product=hypothetical protein / transcript_product=hypothetical protein / location=Cvel_scaffold2436:18535-19853(+) / protein_length=177 / sequence_SO=supercontig / SO=protein_coding / is_pseudo=false
MKVLKENLKKRGEKLEGLEKQATRLEEAASDFAAMARLLAEEPNSFYCCFATDGKGGYEYPAKKSKCSPRDQPAIKITTEDDWFLSKGLTGFVRSLWTDGAVFSKSKKASICSALKTPRQLKWGQVSLFSKPDPKNALDNKKLLTAQVPIPTKVQYDVKICTQSTVASENPCYMIMK